MVLAESSNPRPFDNAVEVVRILILLVIIGYTVVLMVKWVTRKVLHGIIGKLFETHHLMVNDIMRTLCLLCRNYMSNCCAIIVLKI